MFVRNEMAKMHTHAQHDVLCQRHARIEVRARALHGECGLDCGRDDGKFQQQSVAMAFDKTTSMGRQDVLFHLAYELSPSSHHIIFVLLHEPNGLDDVDEHQGPYDALRIVQRTRKFVLNHLPCRSFERTLPFQAWPR
ncbi:hypothetical protein MTX20_19710 [Bradyrhizobium sp. ISRA435]|nr:hypothetical protein MTX20_19710 [Bradyrhizobium sp. ISRA435]